MKTLYLLLAALLLGSVQLYAQSPLEGTWKLISANFTDANGEKSSYDSSQMKQIKILSPTHFIFITEEDKGDSTVFVHSAGGTYQINGNKYKEIIEYASQKDYKKYDTDFTWKVEDDQWYHQGTLTFSDGSKFIIDEVYQKVK